MSVREATRTRKTKETDISVKVSLDGSGRTDIDTGVGFFDHMLDGMARHGFMDLEVKVAGDLKVDDHHTIEDTGIVLGEALKEACGDKAGIKRFGNAVIPMDDALVMAAIDIGGRPYFSYNIDFPTETIGEMKAEMVREFFYALSYSFGINLHLIMIEGINSHHIAEAAFKAFGRALDEATTTDPRIEGVLSTKGSL